MVDFKEDLDLLDGMHDPSNVTFFDKVPDGTYQARLDSIRLAKGRESNKLMTVMEFEVVHGEQEGRTVTKFSMMETPENLDFLTKDVWRVLGNTDPFKWAELEDKIFPQMLDTIVEIKCNTKKESTIQNVFIQNRITKVDNGDKQPEQTKPQESKPNPFLKKKSELPPQPPKEDLPF